MSDEASDRNDTSSQAGLDAALSEPRFVATSVNHPRLVRYDAASIRTFLMAYDQYVKEVTQRALQLAVVDATTVEPVRPVNLTFCVDPEWLESTVDLGFIPDVSDVESLTDAQLREYLESKSSTQKGSLSLFALNSLVEKELQMEMSDNSATSRMTLLLTSYNALLRRHGLKWILVSRPKTAISHILSAVKPRSLRLRLEQDKEFAHSEKRKDFKAFMKHALKVSESFQDVDMGHSRQGSAPKPKKRDKPSLTAKPNQQSDAASSSDKSHKPRSRRPKPFCLLPACKQDGARHWIDECPKATEEQKHEMRNEVAAMKARKGPAGSTRSQNRNNSGQGRRSNAQVSRITNKAVAVSVDSESCTVSLVDGKSNQVCIARLDCGSDHSIVAPSLAEESALKGIGKISPINPISLQVALKKGEKPQTFSFSRSWKTPRTILMLPSGELALRNVSYLIADDDLACEKLLIGNPVLKHLRANPSTILDGRRQELDGIDCAGVENVEVSGGGYVQRLMIARLNREEPESPPLATDRPRVDIVTAKAEEDPFPDPSLLDPIDSAQHEDVVDATKSMLETARNNGMPEEHVQRLNGLVHSHINIFRTALSSGPPASIEPLQIQLNREAQPVRVRLRNYSREQRQFLDKFVSDLVRTKMVYPNPSSPWASAPLVVPKPGPAKFRFTVDLRPVNKFTVKHQFPMPNIEQELSRLAGSRFFATFDLSHGYWQLPLHPNSQACQSFITPDGIFSPTRVLHGTTNATTHMQSALKAVLPPPILQQLLYWLDDMLLHHRKIQGLLDCIEKLFHFCGTHNIRLHPKKSILFSTSVRWCGGLISAEGIRFDPRQLDGLLRMQPPSNGAHLQQFICAMQWMKTGIPDYTNLTSSLHDFLEGVYTTAGKRTARAVARVELASIGWGAEELSAFERCKEALAHLVTLAHRDDCQRLCFYTDASDIMWSGIVTQIPLNDLNKAHKDQRHSPLAFCSGRFNQTQLRWSTLEKESYAIMITLERMHWVAATPDGFDLYTDHNNLVFLFDPLSIVPDLSQTAIRKVLRWAVRLSMYRYTCFHIHGPDNVWGDLLGRWSAPPMVRRLISIPALPSTASEEFVWPSPKEIATLQGQQLDSRPPKLIYHEDLWRNENKAVWIPDSAHDLQLRICIIAHTGPSGHRARDSTNEVLQKYFFWKGMKADVETFVKACIHCLSTTGGNKVPRPFGPAVHGTSPNSLLQFDYIEIGPSHAGQEYILMLRDDHSDYKWLYSFCETSAENAANAIIDWCAAFNVPNGLLSDGPTHFKNETVRNVTKGLKVPHNFTLPYTPWSNGAVERLGKELLRTFRALTSELQMDFQEWTDLVPIIQSILNNVRSPHRGNVAPITAFTGMKASPPISTFMRSCTTTSVSISDAQKERTVNCSKLQELTAQLRPMVQKTLSANRERSRQKASKGTLANFTEGDFVLVAREHFHAGEKLALRWRGPRRVIRPVSDYVYLVEDLRNGMTTEEHASRLKFYHDGSLDTEAILPHVLSSETGMVVSRLVKLVNSKDGIMVHICWKGLPNSEDTLEPITRVYQDVPKMLLRLLKRKATPKNLADKARRVLGL